MHGTARTPAVIELAVVAQLSHGAVELPHVGRVLECGVLGVLGLEVGALPLVSLSAVQPEVQAVHVRHAHPEQLVARRVDLRTRSKQVGCGRGAAVW